MYLYTYAYISIKKYVQVCVQDTPQCIMYIDTYAVYNRYVGVDFIANTTGKTFVGHMYKMHFSVYCV